MIIKNKLYILVLLLFLSLFFGLFAFKLTIHTIANKSADNFIYSVQKYENDDKKYLIEITKKIHEQYVGSSKNTDIHPLYKLRPYFSHRLLPEIIRIKKGAFDTIFTKGLCDSAARTLVYILNKTGYDAEQFNIVSPFGGHSIVHVIKDNGAEILFDPYYGKVPLYQDQLIGPKMLQDLASRNIPSEKIWKNLSPTSSPSKFYDYFGRSSFSRQGHILEIPIHINLPVKTKITIGENNGSINDVNTTQYGWTPYWHYIGSRYDRTWIRKFTFGQDTKLTFVLTEPLNSKFITSNIPPKVDGRKIEYNISKGNELILTDGLAGRDWLNLKSYQDVDYVIIETQNNNI